MSTQPVHRRSRAVPESVARPITNITEELTSKGKVRTVPDSQFPSIVRFDLFEIDLQADGRGERVDVEEA